MLSYLNLKEKDSSFFLFTTRSRSSTNENLKRTGKATFLFVDEELSLYVKTNCKKSKESASETLFLAEIDQVLEDSIPTAEITSGINFKGHDPEMDSGLF